MAFDEDSSSGHDEPWIQWFCGLKGHEMFCEVERSYIEDGFNLYGLRACVSNFSDCLDLILDRIGPDDDSDDSHLTQSACTLYGLIHARYIITAHGLDAMYGKYAAKEFGTCPLVQCGGQPVLPVSLRDEMGVDTVKIYCPKCSQVYHPPPYRSRSSNSASMAAAAAAAASNSNTSGGNNNNNINASGQAVSVNAAGSNNSNNPHNNSSNANAANHQTNIPTMSGSGGIGGVDGAAFGTTFPHLFLMTFSNLVPDPLPIESAYVPRVFGFRVHKAARQRFNPTPASSNILPPNVVASNNTVDVDKNSNIIETTSQQKQKQQLGSKLREIIPTGNDNIRSDDDDDSKSLPVAPSSFGKNGAVTGVVGVTTATPALHDDDDDDDDDQTHPQQFVSLETKQQIPQNQRLSFLKRKKSNNSSMNENDEADVNIKKKEKLFVANNETNSKRRRKTSSNSSSD